MRIRLIGQRNNSGIGTHYAHFCDALRQFQGIGSLVQEIDSFDHQALLNAVHDSRDNDINISFTAINLHGNFRGHNIQWIVFESTRIPENILTVCKDSHQIWVPTAWGRNILEANGIDKNQIRVVPEAVDVNLFHAHGRKPFNKDRPFRFLTVGKYEQRKSIDETIDAFVQVYGNASDVELVLKSNYFVNHEHKFNTLKSKIKNTNNIRLIWGDLSQHDLAELYRSCDVFVLPSRAEGWGLPLIEAAASGLPIITTNYSGQTEFLSCISNSVLPVAFTMSAISCPEYQSYYPNSDNDWGNWAIPDVSSIAKAMQTVFAEYNELFPQAYSNSFEIRKTFTWQNSADLAIKAMSSASDLGQQ